MDTIIDAGRVALSLALVLALMWALAKFAKRPLKLRDGQVMDVLSRQQLSRNSSVALVRVLDRALILGVTDGQVSLVGEADLDAAQEALEEQEAARKQRNSRYTRNVVNRITTVQVNRAREQEAPRARLAAADNAEASPIPGVPVIKVSKHGRNGTATTAQTAKSTSPLAGSALSPGTWRQTVESLRDLTVRSR